VAGNVVPDAVELTLNHRFAPDRACDEAFGALAPVFDDLVDDALGDTVEVVDAVDGATPSLDHPLLAAFVAETGSAPRAKMGWTDVATMSAHGVPATNFGPGDPLLAHHPDERVTRASLERARDVLATVLGRSHV
ncbi:MAG: M20/M25/M40 family metallo-hydrolase, partial [Acidimicrobiales bacterium]